MSIEESIKEILNEKIKLFTEFKTEKQFLERVKRESELADSYKGRELLELLQNVDDAYDVGCGHLCEAYIELDDEYISVSNYGKPFTLDTLQRLCQGNVSGKKGAYIGCKGIGFRSILNWTDEVFICSGSGEQCYSVRFSRTFAEAQYDAIKDNAHVKQQIDELQRLNASPDVNYDITFPMLQAPQYVTPEKKDYDTLIKIKFKSSKLRERIKNDVTKFDKNILLFLPNIKKIILKIKDKFSINEYVYEKIEHESEVEIKSIVNGVCVETKKFIFGAREKELKNGDGESKIVKMAIAVPMEPLPKYGLYTFFPILEETSPFKALLHATFCLTKNRNQLDNAGSLKKINEEIFKSLLDFYVEFVVKNIDAKDRLDMLMPINMRDFLSESFEFSGGLSLDCEKYYLEKCREQPVFSNVNAEALRKDDYPIVLKNVPSVLKGGAFRKVVNISQNKLFNFALKIIDESLKNEDKYRLYCDRFEAIVLAGINGVSSEWGKKQRIEVFKWWHGNGFSALPNLLYDRDGNFLNKEKPCFLSGSITNLPSWAKITVLSEDDEDELLNIYASEINRSRVPKEDDRRVFPRLISKDLVDIQEQSSVAVMISPVNMSVGVNYDYAVEFVQWLWKIWKNARFADTTKNVVFNLPAANGSVKKSRELYLGAEYGNTLGEEFFKNLSYTKLAKIQLEDDKSLENEWEVKEFFSDLGVMEFPEPKPMQFEARYDSGTYFALIKERKYAFDFFKKMFEMYPPYDEDGIKINASSFRLRVNCVENICEILQKADCYSILRWLVQSKKMSRLLEMAADVEAQIEYKPKKRRQEKFFTLLPTASAKCPSFLRYVLSEIKWLDVDGKKVFLQDLLITNNELFKSDFICLTERDLDAIAEKVYCDKKELKKALVNLGAKDGILGCDSKDFYSFLLKLPNKGEDSKKVSREIYRSIIDNNKEGKKVKTKFFEDSKEKEEFFSSGKVLAKNRKGVCEYKLVNEVYFSSSAVFNLNDDFFIDVPTRSGRKDDFKEILNVKPYEIDYEIDGEPVIADCNGDFQEDFKDYLPYLMTYKLGKKDDVCDLSVQLVKKASVKIDRTPRCIDTPYTLLKRYPQSKQSWLIYVGEQSRYAELAKEKIAELLVQIFNVLLNYPSKDFLGKVSELFIYTNNQRKNLIESDFGSLEDFKSTQDEINLSESVRTSLKEHFKKDGILEDVADEIDSIDWFDSSNEFTQEKIVSLLQKIGKDVSYLNGLVSKRISIKPYNRKCLMIEYNQEEDSYRAKIYSGLKDESKMQLKRIWKEFESKVKNYSNEIMESISFNAKNIVKEIESQCLESNKEYLDVEKMEMADSVGIDYKKTYHVNQEKLKDFDKDDMLTAFTNVDENDSLLYFENSSYEEIFKAFVDQQKAQDAEEQTLSAEDIKKMFDNTTISNDLRKGTSKENTGSGGGAVDDANSKKKEKKMKLQGDLAEYFVILKLIEKEIREVNEWFENHEYEIHWVSGASKKVKKIESDKGLYDVTETSDKLGYDIELKQRDGDKKLYLEIKSSSSDGCSFLMSSNEFKKSIDLALDKNSQYRIIFVTGMNSDIKQSKPVIHFIPEAINNEAKFAHIPLKYNIVYKGE